MKESKVRGLIIREAPMGDKDKRLVMLTREMGKIPVLAKGALSAKGKNSAVSQLFCYGDYVLNKGQTFYYIKEAQLIESFYGIRQSLEHLAYGTFMLEVAETLCLDGQENTELMRLLLRGLMAEQKAADGLESLAASAFIWRALAENGFYPELNHCRVCGKNMEGFPPVAVLDLEQGGLVCEECIKAGAKVSSNRVRLCSGALGALRYILEAPEEKVYAFTAQEEVQAQMEEAAVGYLLFQTDRRYGSLDFIGNLRS